MLFRKRNIVYLILFQLFQGKCSIYTKKYILEVFSAHPGNFAGEPPTTIIHYLFPAAFIYNLNFKLLDLHFSHSSSHLLLCFLFLLFSFDFLLPFLSTPLYLINKPNHQLGKRKPDLFSPSSPPPSHRQLLSSPFSLLLFFFFSSLSAPIYLLSAPKQVISCCCHSSSCSSPSPHRPIIPSSHLPSFSFYSFFFLSSFHFSSSLQPRSQ